MIKIKYLWKNNKAQGIVEYALLLSIVIVVGLAIYLPMQHGNNSNGRPIYRTMIMDMIQIYNGAKDLFLKIDS